MRHRFITIFVVLLALPQLAFPAASVEVPRYVSKDGSHFTTASGSPVLWLADTWWYCASNLCPIDGSTAPGILSMYKALVDKRAEQGFNVIQIAFQGPSAPGLGNLVSLYIKPISLELRNQIWRNARRYVEYANTRGLAVAIAATFHTGLDYLSLDQHKLMWQDIIDNLADLDVIWLIAGEYNLMPATGRLDKVDALAEFIRKTDPHHRLLTAHPADLGRQMPTLERSGWMDFVMVQTGHGALAPVEIYQPRQRSGRTVPVVESECRYEGIYGTYTETHVRQCMVRAIMAGAIGFSYGAHGLWYPKQSETDSEFSGFGQAKPWWQAMHYPGATAAATVRRFFETQQWWRMTARPNALFTTATVPTEQQPLVRMLGDERALIWFAPDLLPSTLYSLQGLKPGATYSAQWVRGDLNQTLPTQNAPSITGEQRFTSLPARPDAAGWFLLLQLSNAAISASPPR